MTKSIEKRIAEATAWGQAQQIKENQVKQALLKKYGQYMLLYHPGPKTGPALDVYLRDPDERRCSCVARFKTESQKWEFLNSGIHKDYERDVLALISQKMDKGVEDLECTIGYNSYENIIKTYGSYSNYMRS